jgi:hypothetical protein
MTRINIDQGVWRVVRAAAALEGLAPGRWIEKLARRELRVELAALGYGQSEPSGPVRPPFADSPMGLVLDPEFAASFDLDEPEDAAT